MSETSTKRTIKFVENQKKQGRVQWRVWLAPKEKETLKVKLKEMRKKK